MNGDLWLINKSSNIEKICMTELKRFVTFEPLRPVCLPYHVAMRYQNNKLKICEHPEKYFEQKPLRHLTIRDAGIGDLILLEPCLRRLKEMGNREVSVATRYPEVFENNPYIDNVLKMEHKSDDKNYKIYDYDAFDDLRNYSETCHNRDRIHRTECYNQIYKLQISDEDYEPRLFFKKNEPSLLKKEKGKRYVAVSFDASHYYRCFEKGTEALQYLVQQDERTIFVVIGSWNFVKVPKHKRIIDMQGQTDIRDSIMVVKECDYLIAADSGMMHVGLTLHVPTVCIFSIIRPQLRVKYYRGPRKIIWRENCGKPGCGSLHMAVCRHGDKKKDEDFIPPCMHIEPKELWEALQGLEPNEKRRMFFKNEEKKNGKQLASNIIPIKTISSKIVMPIIVLNEEKNLPRFIELVMSHNAIGRVIAIDGGSTDKTVALLKKAGAEVYEHPYLKSYHEQQAMQRNISCSYCNNGDKVLIMDIDECFSKGLSDYLYYLAESNIQYGLIARKTFNYYADISDESKRIKDWPDYQPRWYIWDRKYKFVNGAHHITLNTPEPVKIDTDKFIVHFEKEGKDRVALESQWANMMSKVKQYA